MNELLIHKGSYYKLFLENNVVVAELDPNIRVTKPMFQEFYNSWQQIYEMNEAPFPLMVLVNGILSMDREARELASLSQKSGFINVCAVVTSNRIWFSMMKLIISITSSDDMPKSYFTNKEEAFIWIYSHKSKLNLETIRFFGN